MLGQQRDAGIASGNKQALLTLRFPRKHLGPSAIDRNGIGLGSRRLWGSEETPISLLPTRQSCTGWPARAGVMKSTGTVFGAAAVSPSRLNSSSTRTSRILASCKATVVLGT